MVRTLGAFSTTTGSRDWGWLGLQPTHASLRHLAGGFDARRALKPQSACCSVRLSDAAMARADESWRRAVLFGRPWVASHRLKVNTVWSATEPKPCSVPPPGR